MDIVNKIKILKKKGKKIGLIHGVFDVIHIGHIWYFKNAKKLVDSLFISVTSDEYVNKGPGKPIFDIHKRVELLESFNFFEKVIISKNQTAVEVIKKIKPDYYIKGQDYRNLKNDLSKQIIEEKKAVESFGGKLTFTDTPLYSSSSIINQNFDFLTDEAKKYLENSKNKYLVNNFKNLISNLSSKKIFLIGDSILDIIKFVKPSGKSNKNNIIATQFIKQETNLGGALLALNYLSQFFKQIEYLFVGTENDFKFIKRNLNKNIKINFIKSKNKLIKKIRYVDEYSLNRLFQNNENENQKIEKNIKDKIIKMISIKSKKADQIILFDYGYLYSFKELIGLIDNFSKKTVINCQSNSYNFGFNLANKYKKCRVLGMDESELRLITQDKHLELKQLIKKNIKLFQKNNTTIITQGKKGCFFVNKNKINFVPTIINRSVDSTGSGDVFLSTYAMLDLYKKFTIHEMGVICHIVAGIHANELGNRFNLNKSYLKNIVSSVLK
jgi:rfaE bifunctional protein nucleotidyltransferase chain/domain